jgi:hypothetical protein
VRILDFIVPEYLRDNTFIISLHKQFTKSGTLTKKQVDALEDALEIELDFYGCNIPVPEEHLEDFEKLLAKFRRNRFHTIKSKNKCIRAMNSIIDGVPDRCLINNSLGRGFFNRGYNRYNSYNKGYK